MCKFDNQHIVEELKNKLGYGWYVYPVNIHQHSAKTHRKPRMYSGVVYCVHCRSNNILEIFEDSYGTMTGGAAEWVYQCKDCKKSMTVEHEWE